MSDPLSLAHPGKNTPFGRDPSLRFSDARKYVKIIDFVSSVCVCACSDVPRFQGLWQAWNVASVMVTFGTSWRSCPLEATLLEATLLEGTLLEAALLKAT